MPPPPLNDQTSLVDSFRRLAAWLREHDGADLLQSLSPGTKPLHLSKLEQKLGFRVPAGLRTWWMLHDGQKRRGDSLIGALQLLPVAWVLNERPKAIAKLRRVRGEPAFAAQAGLTPDEAASDEWIPIAVGEALCVLVQAKSGRVFATLEEAPFLQRVGDSVPKWIAAWVDEVEAGRHELVQSHDGVFFVEHDARDDDAAAVDGSDDSDADAEDTDDADDADAEDIEDTDDTDGADDADGDDPGDEDDAGEDDDTAK